MRRRAALGIFVWAVSILLACSATGLRLDTPTPSPSPSVTKSEPGQLDRADVVRVIDGTTIEVNLDGTLVQVRYLGIEVPDERIREATEFNTFLVNGRTVELEREDGESDPAGRLLRYVYVQGEMVNLALLTNGYASVGDTPADFKHETAFMVAQQNAKADRRGIWHRSEEADGKGGESEQEFAGGTLPQPRETEGGPACDYSGTDEPVIKGNVERRTGERLYHVPGGFFYEATAVDESAGDRWFCTEEEALATGWKRSKR